MLATGTNAPDFSAPNELDQTVTLAIQLKKGPFILYFYPADFTPGCTREACALRDMHDDLLATGLHVLGVSQQSTESHRRFKDKYQLPFHLLSDPGKALIKAYECNGPFGVGLRRTSYLVDAKGVVRGAIRADFKVVDHVSFFRQAADLIK